MGKIILEDIEIYAYHGHLPEERKIGSKFLVNLEMMVSLDEACLSDELDDTFDYSEAYAIVCEEMKTPSALLEHVAQRILSRLFTSSSKVQEAKVKVSKLNPPFGGDVKAVCVELQKERGKE